MPKKTAKSGVFPEDWLDGINSFETVNSQVNLIGWGIILRLLQVILNCFVINIYDILLNIPVFRLIHLFRLFRLCNFTKQNHNDESKGA